MHRSARMIGPVPVIALTGEAIMTRLAYVRDFLAITGLFGTIYGWFFVGAALVA